MVLFSCALFSHSLNIKEGVFPKSFNHYQKVTYPQSTLPNHLLIPFQHAVDKGRGVAMGGNGGTGIPEGLYVEGLPPPPPPPPKELILYINSDN